MYPVIMRVLWPLITVPGIWTSRKPAREDLWTFDGAPGVSAIHGSSA